MPSPTAKRNRRLPVAAGWLKRLASDRKGQVVVEFMLGMVIIMLLTLVIIEVCTLGADMMLTRYASFAAARGYLSHADYERGGEEAATSLVINNTGSVDVEAVGDKGVRLKVEIREFFPIRTLFGGDDKTILQRETFLGREPYFRGDNMPTYGGGGFWD